MNHNLGNVYYSKLREAKQTQMTVLMMMMMTILPLKTQLYDYTHVQKTFTFRYIINKCV